MKPGQLQLVPPPADVAVAELPVPPGWWEAPEFRALADLRRAMVGGAVPAAPPQTAEESARHAVFWALFEIEHLLARAVKLIEAGEDVRVRSSVYTHEERRVEIGLRIIGPEGVAIRPPSRGAP